LRNLFASTQIATVLRDGELIGRFTPAVTSIFDLISTDLGEASHRHCKSR
jgi:hypothetical protein